MKTGLAAVLLCAGAAWGQQFEVGGVFGYGWYRNGSVTAAGQSATIGVTDRIAAGAIVCQDMYDHVSGEARYLYQGGHEFIAAPGARIDAAGRTHTLNYDFLLHWRDRESRLRPYVAVGAGAKYYQASAVGPGSQPFQVRIALADQWRFAADWGAGVKYRLHPNVTVRAEFRDYISPLPNASISGVGGASVSRISQMFTPLIGLSYSF